MIVGGKERIGFIYLHEARDIPEASQPRGDYAKRVEGKTEGGSRCSLTLIVPKSDERRGTQNR